LTSERADCKMFAMLIRRLMYTIILFSLLVSLVSFFPRSAGAEAQKWSRLNIPGNGAFSNWVLAKGSDIRHLRRAADGTLYCYASPGDASFRFFKSLDSGVSWSYCGRVEEEIVDIAVSSEQPRHVYYATSSAVYQSLDAGDSFQALAAGPGGAGQNGVKITSIDAVTADGNDRVVAATCNSRTAQFGGVFLWDGGEPHVWKDLGVGELDVYCVRFSPAYAARRQIVAVASDEIDTLVTAASEGEGWGTEAGIAVLERLIPFSAEIAFPDDYDSVVSRGKYVQYIALDSGGKGDVFRLKGRPSSGYSEIVDLNAGVALGLEDLDIASLAVSGEAAGASLMAGSADSATIWLSRDGGNSWNMSVKSPSGSSVTGVVMAPDNESGSLAFAVTCGEESAFSLSRDKGLTWAQTSLVDSQIYSVVDLAVSPAFTSDGTLYILTAGPVFSLWRGLDGGSTWQRVFSNNLTGVGRLDCILLSPDFTQNSTLFLFGLNAENDPVIWKSPDGGRTFVSQLSKDPVNGAPVNIDAWAIAADDVIYTSGCCGVDCFVYRTGVGGSLPYQDRGLAGDCLASSLALSPDFVHDRTLLLGNTLGGVYLSIDGGRVFESFTSGFAQSPLKGKIKVAFDAGYKNNRTVYAADSTKDKGIFRGIRGSGDGFVAIDSNLQRGARVNALSVTPQGVLYAAYSRNEKDGLNQGGMERSLDPTSPAPFFETVNSGLEETVSLYGTWTRDNTVWSLNTAAAGVVSYVDLLVSPVSPLAPRDGESGLDKNGIQISWQAQQGAGRYHWQIDTDDQFVILPKSYEGDTDSLMVNLPNLDARTVYYWRVRTNLPVAGLWSPTRRFDTIPPLAAPKLSSPSSSSRAGVRPVFKWSVSEGAESYDLLVARDENFDDLVIDKCGENGCAANTWKCNKTLKYNSSYFWKVRALAAEKNSQWSGTGLFTTEKESSGSSSGGGGHPPGNTTTPANTPAPAPINTSAPTGTPASTVIAAASPAPVITPTPSVSPSPSASTPVIASPAAAPPVSTPAYTAAVSPAGFTPAKTPDGTIPLASPPAPASSLPAAEISPVSSPEPATGAVRLAIGLGSILIVLLVGLAFLVAYILKKFKRY
jgi:hypothetical protein